MVGRFSGFLKVQYQPAKAPASTSCPKASMKKTPQKMPKRLMSWRTWANVEGPYLKN